MRKQFIAAALAVTATLGIFGAASPASATSVKTTGWVKCDVYLAADYWVRFTEQYTNTQTHLTAVEWKASTDSPAPPSKVYSITAYEGKTRMGPFYSTPVLATQVGYTGIKGTPLPWMNRTKYNESIAQATLRDGKGVPICGTGNISVGL